MILEIIYLVGAWRSSLWEQMPDRRLVGHSAPMGRERACDWPDDSGVWHLGPRARHIGHVGCKRSNPARHRQCGGIQHLQHPRDNRRGGHGAPHTCGTIDHEQRDPYGAPLAAVALLIIGNGPMLGSGGVPQINRVDSLLLLLFLPSSCATPSIRRASEQNSNHHLSPTIGRGPYRRSKLGLG